jgi:hypothetical protein
MVAVAPRLYADERGIWREDTPGRAFGINWGDVYAVSGHKLDGVTEVYTCVVLDYDYGVFIELYHDWPGFPEVVAAITSHLPGIAPDWFSRIEQLKVDDPPLHVWRRD